MKSSFSEAVYQYALAHSSPEHPLLQRLRRETASMPEGMMQIPPEQGRLMAMLAQVMGAKRVLEVGVFTGYSSLSVALALPTDGRILACDVSEKYTRVARRYWQEAGVEKKIDLRLGPAAETLRGLVADRQGGQFDMAFIDADKANYDTYYEHCLELVHPGGLILVDNTLWSGKVVNAPDADEDTRALVALNRKIAADHRVQVNLLPLADGLTLARRQ